MIQEAACSSQALCDIVTSSDLQYIRCQIMTTEPIDPRPTACRSTALCVSIEPGASLCDIGMDGEVENIYYWQALDLM